MNRQYFKESFSHIIEHSEWFNKVLVGGLYVVLIPIGMGIILLNGFLFQTSEMIFHDEKGLPQWRNFKALMKTGIKPFPGTVVIVCLVYFLSRNANLIELCSLIALGITLNSLLTVGMVIRKLPGNRANHFLITIFQFISSYVLILCSLCFGWMFIVAGWPLVIFLMMLIQVILLSKIFHS